MSESPAPVPPEDEQLIGPDARRPRRLWKILAGVGIGIGSIVTVGGVVFWIWGDRIVTNLLLPRVAQTLDESIKRPVELGDVEGFTFWGVRLGPTVIPPTETDASSVTVDAIEVNIGLRSLIFQQTIKSEVVLIRPEVSLVQSETGQWLELDLPEPSEAERPIELEIQSIEVKNAKLTALPYVSEESEAVVAREAVQIEDTDVLIEFFGESAQETTFELDGEVVAVDPDGVNSDEKVFGSFALRGAANLETQSVKLDTRLINLPSVGANLLLPDSLGIRRGALSGNIKVVADFEEGELDQSSLDVRGAAQFEEGEFVVAALPEPIQNISSDLIFKEQQISLEDASLQLSDVVLLADGDVDLTDGFDISANIPSVSVAQVQSLFDFDVPVAVAGAFALEAQVTGALDSPVLDGQLVSSDSLLIDEVALDSAEADFRLTLPAFQLSRFNLDRLEAQLATGGRVVAGGTADLSDLENIAFQLDGQADLSVDPLARAYGLVIPEETVLGVLSADFVAAGGLDAQVVSADWQLSEGTLVGRGQAELVDDFVRVENALLSADQGTVTADASLNLESGEWRAIANTNQVAISQFTNQVSGDLNADVEAFGNINRLGLDQIEANGSAFVANVNGDSGSADADFALARGLWNADIQADQIALSQFTNQVQGLLSADVEASGEVAALGDLADLNLTGITAAGTAFVSNVNGDSGSAEAEFALARGAWDVAASTSGIAVGQFTDQAQGLLNADVVASGSLSALGDLRSLDSLADINLAQISASGTAVVEDGRLGGRAAALLDPGDLTAAFELRGNAIALTRFSAPGIQADGDIALDLTRGIPIGDIALNVSLDSYDLQRLNAFLPDSVTQYARIDGTTSFNGRLTGNLDNPQIAGTARVDTLAVNELLFESISGPVAFALADGGQIDLRGQQDRLQLRLQDAPQQSIPYLPISFEVRNQDLIARGITEGSLLRAEVVQLPLERLAIRPASRLGLGTVTGMLAANVNVDISNLSNPSAAGRLVVTQPGLEPVEAQRLNATFTYADGTAALSEGELLFEEGRYLVSGSANVVGDVEYQGELTVAEGRIEDFTPLIQALNLSALGFGGDQDATGSAIDLGTQPVGLPEESSFLAKLESFEDFLEANPELNTDAGTVARGRVLSDTDLPPLEDLEGEFSGNIAFAGSSLSFADATADFNLQGDSWEWGENTPPNSFVLRGEVAQSSIEIEQASVDAGETEIELTASGGLDNLDGTLQVEALPVEIAQLFYPLPADVGGDLSLSTTFDGSLANPAIAGEATIADFRINDYLFAGAEADFNYRNAILALESEVAVSRDFRPIQVEGRVPYMLPFAEVLPQTSQVAITAVVPNGNLEIVNALSDERVQWQSGEGEIVVNVGGTVFSPAVVGRASFRDAAISSSLLASDVTRVNGEVLFDLNRIEVEQLRAEIDDGRIAVDGSLPLLASGESVLSQLAPGFFTFFGAPTADIPQAEGSLTIALESLPLDYDDLVRGVFDGQLLVAGAALSPTVSGVVQVNDGLVRATNVLQNASAFGSDDDEVETISPYRADFLNIDPLVLEAAQPKGFVGEILDSVALSNLQILLGDRLTITAQPLFSVTALGELNVNGTLADIQPSGVVEVLSGRVNLFATQFRLDRTVTNTAIFTPENGLDPTLDVVLRARVQETDIDPLPPPTGGFANAEVNEATIDTAGDVQFISVEAIAQGPASEIADGLTLTSRPSREQGELLALIGGGTVSGIATASLTQIGGFLGDGALSTFGDRIADAVGLQSFRVFPTTDTSDDSSVGIGIGVEASAAIGDRFNINVLEILNSTSPPQLGVLYRISDELSVRGASNLDDTDFEIEYRIDF